MTYGLVAIVKDEAKTIEGFLEGVKPYISHWVICDTGSTDGTQAIIRRALADIPGELYEDEWRNFGHNRTLAFQRARGTADWLLALDADMTLTIEDGWEPNPKYHAYAVRMGEGSALEWWLPLILRGDLPWASFGVVHEYTALEGNAPYEGQAAAHVKVTYADRSSPEKSEWHATLLRAALEENPNDARSTFYLAQTYKDQGKDAEAREMYLKRATMGGWDQEVFWSAYMAAAKAPDWPTRLAGLITAWSLRPERLEPLYDLVHALTERGEHAAAYALCPREMPPVTHDSLFVYPAVYTWGLRLERAVAAWNVGHYEESRELSRDLLNYPMPDEIRKVVETNSTLPDPT